MKIVLAADGSDTTKKALAYVVTHENIVGPDDELIVLNVQPALPPRVRSAVGADVARDYQADEAEKVLKPIRKFLGNHELTFRCEWVVGNAAEQVLRMAEKSKAHMIVMGTHGHGALGRAILGSVAQKVVVDAKVPVLLVK
jgi:nucleotide-binding universal stress UspA family protein